MEIVALAGGVGAGKFLRGLHAVARERSDRVTVIVNTGDDIELHGLHVSPDLDSVCYWLSGSMDRERGWGRADETFNAVEQLRSMGVDAWFNLGDRDLATHLVRSQLLRGGASLSGTTGVLARDHFGLTERILPMSDDPVTTRIDVVDPYGTALDLHFQEYWVRRGARDSVKQIRYVGSDRASALPDALDAIAGADAVLLCPSNPVASIGPILAIPGYRNALQRRRDVVAGVSPIIGGAPLGGMADLLMPAAGLEVSALGAARAYDGLLAGWVIDRRDASSAAVIADALDVRVAVTDSVMVDDEVARALAVSALDLLRVVG
ncbi:MAG: 2-phospho-L-lactate transferase [Actinomycetota bacterium]